eukprot:TRINITY_DN1577_c0_g1_i1.p1 TRINITY_DN1577_c0_g1~~TRINITY_DN1577_c0_g1_i1.p1  ORF type:complete len:351 (-),score=142.75 TRINITY_DN1577_c0_g1_i1:143-1195(-)
MIKWLQEKGEQTFQGINARSPTKKKGGADEENLSEQSDEEEAAPDLPAKTDLVRQHMQKYARTSVSAEAYGMYNQKAAFKPRVIAKNEDQKLRILNRLSQAFMFSALDDNEKEIIILAMEEKKFRQGDKVIVQGDDGDDLYVVDSGTLSCFRKSKKDDQENFLKTYTAGDAFGELALLYNAPRAATIIADGDCTLFALDRQTFNHIVKDAAAKKREKYEHFLSRVELLDTVDPYERSKIADALKPMKFRAGEYVVKEGENGDTFFFIEDGEAYATKKRPDNTQETVYNYKVGDYFGELALLKNTPRAASIRAKTDLSVVALDRFSFKRLLGPLDEILKRNFARYEKYSQI